MPENKKPYKTPYEEGDTIQKGLSKVASLIVPGEKERQQRELEKKARADCLAQGGIWDDLTKSCKFPPKGNNQQPNQPPKVISPNPEVFTDKSGRPSGVSIGGRDFLGLSQDDVNEISQRELSKTQLPPGTAPVGTAQAQVNKAFQSQQLAGQVGQFGELPVSPTGLDFGEAATAGIVGSIPKALSLGVTGALAGGLVGGSAGAAGAPITGGLSIPAGAAIGAVGGFVSGVAGSMISNFKSQRTDTTTSQQRVLDEGKQTMKDWATMAEADPANKATYLTEYNKVAAQIDQAYRQMKLDTNRDVAKFETALPNLAEFEAFYAAGGERDTLDNDMRNALLMPSSAEYKMLELAQRRQGKV